MNVYIIYTKIDGWRKEAPSRTGREIRSGQKLALINHKNKMSIGAKPLTIKDKERQRRTSRKLEKVCNTMQQHFFKIGKL